jgi:hypothetical protein
MEATRSVLERFSRLVGSFARTRSSRSADQPKPPPGNQRQDLPEPLSGEALRIIGALRQGDIVEIDGLPVVGNGGVRSHPTPHGAVLITQTCDAVRPEKPTVAVVPIARVGGGAAKNARDGKLLRYVPLPAAGLDVFADLSLIATIDKARLVALPRLPGIDPTSDDEIRRFGRAIGRRFGRFPFPDEVVPWLRPLEVVVQSKHDKDSAEGAAMRDVVELRVEAIGGWLKPPYALTLCVIVRPGVVPAFPDDEQPRCPTDLSVWLRTESGDLRQTPAAIAGRLETERRRSRSSASVYWLWLSLAEAWAALCIPDVRKCSQEEAASVLAAVSGIDADVIEESSFDLYRYRRSEQLDLDHLSPPTPI